MTTTTLEPGWPVYAGEFTLPEMLNNALQSVVTEYINRDVPLPGRQYWTIGETAHDCEQLVLCWTQMALGTTEQPLETIQCSGPRYITFTIEVLRCVPGLDNRGKAPAGEAIEAASVNPVIDAEILMDCAKYFDPFTQGAVVTVNAIGGDGGVHGVIATYSVNL